MPITPILFLSHYYISVNPDLPDSSNISHCNNVPIISSSILHRMCHSYTSAFIQSFLLLRTFPSSISYFNNLSLILSYILLFMCHSYICNYLKLNHISNISFQYSHFNNFKTILSSIYPLSSPTPRSALIQNFSHFAHILPAVPSIRLMHATPIINFLPHSLPFLYLYLPPISPALLPVRLKHPSLQLTNKITLNGYTGSWILTRYRANGGTSMIMAILLVVIPHLGL